jgi:hypothetical protein
MKEENIPLKQEYSNILHKENNNSQERKPKIE